MGVQLILEKLVARLAQELTLSDGTPSQHDHERAGLALFGNVRTQEAAIVDLGLRARGDSMKNVPEIRMELKLICPKAYNIANSLRRVVIRGLQGVFGSQLLRGC